MCTLAVMMEPTGTATLVQACLTGLVASACAFVAVGNALRARLWAWAIGLVASWLIVMMGVRIHARWDALAWRFVLGCCVWHLTRIHRHGALGWSTLVHWALIAWSCWFSSYAVASWVPLAMATLAVVWSGLDLAFRGERRSHQIQQRANTWSAVVVLIQLSWCLGALATRPSTRWMAACTAWLAVALQSTVPSVRRPLDDVTYPHPVPLDDPNPAAWQHQGTFADPPEPVRVDAKPAAHVELVLVLATVGGGVSVPQPDGPLWTVRRQTPVHSPLAVWDGPEHDLALPRAFVRWTMLHVYWPLRDFCVWDTPLALMDLWLFANGGGHGSSDSMADAVTTTLETGRWRPLRVWLQAKTAAALASLEHQVLQSTYQRFAHGWITYRHVARGYVPRMSVSDLVLGLWRFQSTHGTPAATVRFARAWRMLVLYGCSASNTPLVWFLGRQGTVADWDRWCATARGIPVHPGPVDTNTNAMDGASFLQLLSSPAARLESVLADIAQYLDARNVLPVTKEVVALVQQSHRSYDRLWVPASPALPTPLRSTTLFALARYALYTEIDDPDETQRALLDCLHVHLCVWFALRAMPATSQSAWSWTSSLHGLGGATPSQDDESDSLIMARVALWLQQPATARPKRPTTRTSHVVLRQLPSRDVTALWQAYTHGTFALRRTVSQWWASASVDARNDVMHWACTRLGAREGLGRPLGRRSPGFLSIVHALVSLDHDVYGRECSDLLTGLVTQRTRMEFDATLAQSQPQPQPHQPQGQERDASAIHVLGHAMPFREVELL